MDDIIKQISAQQILGALGHRNIPYQERLPGRREDGSLKGIGWLGKIPMLNNPENYMTELSMGVNLNGNETLIPSIVPTLTQEEIKHLSSGGNITDEIAKKAIDHALMRINGGFSPFVD